MLLYIVQYIVFLISAIYYWNPLFCVSNNSHYWDYFCTFLYNDEQLVFFTVECFVYQRSLYVVLYMLWSIDCRAWMNLMCYPLKYGLFENLMGRHVTKLCCIWITLISVCTLSLKSCTVIKKTVGIWQWAKNIYHILVDYNIAQILPCDNFFFFFRLVKGIVFISPSFTRMAQAGW